MTASAGQSRAAFTKDAVALCEQAQQDISARLKEHVREYPGSLNIQPEIARDRLVMKLIRPIVERQADGLAALPAPKGGEGKIIAIKVATDEAIDAAAGDPEATILGTYREANRLAVAYGLRACEIP